MDGFSPPRIVHVAETGSTNADAARLALAGEALPLWVMADTQTGGRGRAGRQWISEPGNLHASLAFRSMAPMARAGQLSLLAGIAIIDAVRTTLELAPNTELRLKWPNDILIGFAKAGGILVESTSFREGSGFLAILGFGLNLVTFPKAIGRNAAALADYGAPPTPRALIANLSERLGFWLDRWAEGENFAILRQAWMDRAGPLGEPILVNTQSGPLAATYEGLTETGALLAKAGGAIREINFGDVALAGEVARDGDT
jgi:BirA family biotin operon repressor/biotin-[acetyl-CoA-carboxylase] ligase